MADPSPIFIASPLMLILAMLFGAGIVGVGLWRRIQLPHVARLLAILGLASLALALADVKWRNEPNRRVVVMVDQSASTRGAAFRDESTLNQRISQLLVGVGFRKIDFDPSREGFNPPPAAAVLLFSDGQFTPPDVAPPTFIAIDPTLDAPADASIEEMGIRNGVIAIDVSVRGPSRTLTITQDSDQITRELAPGRYTITHPPVPGTYHITAAISAGDLWPENDAMTIIPPPPLVHERWWIGNNAPQTGWRNISPAQLPIDAANYLAPAVIVLNNIPADSLSALQQDRLQEYVRDLGGGLAIIGGDNAFAAGHYPGTVMETLSPLASTPPAPLHQWILLVDASGSMAAPFEQSTRWNFAANAIMRAVQVIPPDDLVDIGSFAKDVRWWSTGQSARTAAALEIPAISPSGPTNLEPAIKQFAEQARAATPTNLLILTDAETTIADATTLSASLRSKLIRVHFIATRPIPRDHALFQLAEYTGGSVIVQSDPRKWADEAIQLARGALPDEIIRQPIQVRFLGLLQSLGSTDVSVWNRTWLKNAAASLGEADAQGETVSMCASWPFGTGKTIAAAFPTSASQAQAMADLVASPPRDPRFTVNWRSDSILVDAIDGDAYLTDLKLSLRLGEKALAIPQTAPGQYELHFDPPLAPVLARVDHGSRPIDRRALAGHYPREFAAIGNNTAGLKDLAARTGGEWIPPEQIAPIKLPPAPDGIPLTPWFSIAGAILIGLALIAWKRMV